MTTDPRLGIDYMDTQQGSKEVTFNNLVNRTSALVQTTIVDKDLSAPPGSPADGALYIVASSPSGAWAGQAGKLAQWIGAAWTFYTPFEGLRGWVADEDSLYVHSGSAWERHGARLLEGSKTHDWANIATAAEANTTVTVTGAALGDYAEFSMSVSLAGLKGSAYVSAADTVTVILRNDTGAGVDLASGTLRARVRKA